MVQTAGAGVVEAEVEEVVTEAEEVVAVAAAVVEDAHACT